MSGIGDIFSEIDDFATQSYYDLGLQGATESEEPKKREERKAKEKAAKEKIAARGRIKPIPDPGAGKAAARRTTARRRAQRGGRASTILSSKETLG